MLEAPEPEPAGLEVTAPAPPFVEELAPAAASTEVAGIEPGAEPMREPDGAALDAGRETSIETARDTVLEEARAPVLASPPDTASERVSAPAVEPAVEPLVEPVVEPAVEPVVEPTGAALTTPLNGVSAELVVSGAGVAAASVKEAPVAVPAAVAAARPPAEPRPTRPVLEFERASWPVRAAEQMWRDLRLALRALVRHPVLTIVAVLSSALAVGLITAVFGWVEALMLRPISGVERGEQLVLPVNETVDGRAITSSYRDYLDYRQSDTLAGLVAFGMTPLQMRSGTGTERVWGSIVSGNYFDVLGVRPAAGRFFLPDEDATPGLRPVAVLGHGLWTRRFGRRPNVVGETVTLNGQVFTIIGIAPEAFKGTFTGLTFDVWVPLMMTQQVQPETKLDDRGYRWLFLMGRLRDTATVEQARAALPLVGERVARAAGVVDQRVKLVVYRLAESPWGVLSVMGPVLTTLFALGLVVLGISCANVASLLLSRASARRKEVATRMAIGSGRFRIVQQLLTESVLLALIGGACGIALAALANRELQRALPSLNLPLSLDAQLNPAVLAFALAVTLVTGIVFGLAPALQLARTNLVSNLKDADEQETMFGARGGRFRSALVVLQLALSVLLLVCTGLLVRSLQNAQAADPGFNARNLFSIDIDVHRGGTPVAESVPFFETLLLRLSAMSELESASVAATVPLGFSSASFTGFEVEGYTPRPDEQMDLAYNAVSARYFATMGIPLVQGREFSERDTRGAPGVAIINETMARRYWPGQSALGRRLHTGGDWLEVVGVAKDSKYVSLGEPSAPHLYLSFLQAPRADAAVIVRGRGASARLALALRQEIQGLDANVGVTELRSMEGQLAGSLFPQRLMAVLLAIVALLALVLAAIGVYGVMAYSVSRRTHEFGLRMALGAEAKTLFRMVVGEGLRIGVLGIVLGLAASAVVTQLLVSQLYGIGAFDPMTFGLVSALLFVVTIAASVVPAWWSASTPLSQALRGR